MYAGRRVKCPARSVDPDDMRHTKMAIALVLGLAATAAAADPQPWYRIRIPGARVDLLVDLQRGHVWPSGHCDTPMTLRGVERTGTKWKAEAVRESNWRFPRVERKVEETIALEVDGERGRIRWSNTLAPAPLLRNVTVRPLGAAPCPASESS